MNGSQAVIDHNDHDPLPAGTVGLITATDGNAVEVEFDDFVVTQI